jgi:ABC-type amino acid transport substrate-binding protein
VRLHYAKYGALREALAAVAEGDADAVVNSVGALRYMAAARFPRTLRIPNSLLAPAYSNSKSSKFLGFPNREKNDSAWEWSFCRLFSRV